MNDKLKRSERRFHRARKYRHAREVLKEWFGVSLKGHYSWNGWREPQFTMDEFHRRVCQHRDNLAICSCSMCRNPRRAMWGCYDDRVTMQERKQDDRFRDGMEEAVELLYDRKYGEDDLEE